MIKIRLNTFETNSSSTHALIMCTEDEFNKFVNGELYIDVDNYCLLTKTELLDEVKDDMIRNPNFYVGCDSEDDCICRFLSGTTEIHTYESFDNYLSARCFEYFEKTYKTKDNTNVVAFGFFGYDG